MRTIITLLIVAAIGGGVWLTLRDGGFLDRVTESRVERMLIDNGVSERMAQCMAPRLVDRLSIEQLEKLERLAPEGDEAALPTSSREALARLRRVDDREALEQVVVIAGGCGLEQLLEKS